MQSIPFISLTAMVTFELYMQLFIFCSGAEVEGKVRHVGLNLRELKLGLTGKMPCGPTDLRA